jgi:RNA polymerase sigma-70 factor (ECF subfamily)
VVEPEDFVALMAREYVPLVRVATVIVGDPGLGEEVVQEAFTRALVRWRRVSRYERPGAWVRLVTVRLSVRAAAKRRREGLGAAVPDGGSIDPTRDVDLTAAIAGLPEADRTVIVLHYLCDLPIEEVAEIVGTSPGTARVRLHRARARLAGVLSEEGEDVATA